MYKRMDIKNKKGIALLTAYFAIFALTIISTAFLSRSISEKKTSEHYEKSTQAFWVAESGIQQTLWELNSNNCNNCQTCGNNQCLAGTITGFGDYDVTIDLTNNTLSSIGSAPSRSSNKLVARTVAVDLAGGASSFFTHALYSNNGIEISNNARIDSFDSSIGLYNVDGNINTNGNIGTNSTSSQIIDIGNNAYVGGDVSTGPGGTVAAGNNATITGSTTDTNDNPLESVIVPSSLTSLASGGAKTVNKKGSWIINSGSYKFDSITLENKVNVTISGDVTLYVTGDLDVGNKVDITITTGASLTYYTDGEFELSNNSAVNNMTKIPANFIIYSTYSGGDGIELENNSEFYGAVYAPDTDISISNNADSYGAFVGNAVDVSNNGAVHYDEALASMTGGGSSSGYSISVWEEL